VPTASGPAPLLDASPEVSGRQNWASLVLLSIAVLGQLPQISVPGAEVGGAPIGISLIGAAGSDERLLDLAAELASVEPSRTQSA
jgi:amidase